MSEETKNRTLVIDDTSYETKYTDKFLHRTKYTPANPKHLLAYIPGVIQEIHITAGQKVKWGEKLMVLEAMKMRNDVTAALDGTIKAIHVNRNDKVMKNQLLIEFE